MSTSTLTGASVPGKVDAGRPPPSGARRPRRASGGSPRASSTPCVGVLAVPIAIQGCRHDRATRAVGDEASQLGAVAEIADSSFGDGRALDHRHRAGAVRPVAADLDRAAGREHGQDLAHPRRLLRQRDHVLACSPGRPSRSPPTPAPPAARRPRTPRSSASPATSWSSPAGRWLVGAIGVVCRRRRRLLRGQGRCGRRSATSSSPAASDRFSHESIVTPRPGRLGRPGHRDGPRRLVPDQCRRPVPPRGGEGLRRLAARGRPDSTLGPLLVGFAAVGLIVYGAVLRDLGASATARGRRPDRSGPTVPVTLAVLLAALVAAGCRLGAVPVAGDAGPRRPRRRGAVAGRLASVTTRGSAPTARAIDRQAVGGLMLAVALAIVFVTALVVGVVFDMVDRDSGLARWDSAVADWGSANATALVDRRARRAHRSRRHGVPRRHRRRRRDLRLRPPPQRERRPVPVRRPRRRGDHQQRRQVDRRPGAPRRPAPRRDVRLLVPVRALGGRRGGVVRPRARRQPSLVRGAAGRRPLPSPRSSRSRWPRPAPSSACTG